MPRIMASVPAGTPGPTASSTVSAPAWPGPSSTRSRRG